MLTASRDTEPLLTCVDAAGRASGFGQLSDGLLVSCSSALCRRLLTSAKAAVLEALGEAIQFEVAVGLNGKLWVNAGNMESVILVSHAITNSEQLSPAQVKVYVKKLVQSVA